MFNLANSGVASITSLIKESMVSSSNTKGTSSHSVLILKICHQKKSVKIGEEGRLQNLRVYLDNCCYNIPYDDQTQLRISLESQAKLNIQTRIKNGEIELATSYMTFFENSENPYEMRRNIILDF